MFLNSVEQEEVSIAKEEWELGHLKAIKEEDERRAEIEEDDMLYTSLHESPRNKSSTSAKPGKSKRKLYSYGGWEFASFDDDEVTSFLDDSGSQTLEDDTSTEPSLINSRFATLPKVRSHKKPANSVKTKLSGRKKIDSKSVTPVTKRKYWTKKRRVEFGMGEGGTENVVGGKRPKLSAKSSKLQKLQKKVGRPAEEKAVEMVTLDGKSLERQRQTVQLRNLTAAVGKVPRLKSLKPFTRPSTEQHQRPIIRPIRSSDLGIRPPRLRMPLGIPRTGAQTIAEMGAHSPPQPTPILEKLGAAVLASPSAVNQSRLTQIVSSISAAAALQNTVLGNAPSSIGTIQYVIKTNGRPAVPQVRQTPVLVGTSATVGSNLRSNVVYQIPPTRHQLQPQTLVSARPFSSQSQRSVLPSRALPTSATAARHSFVLTAPGGDRQSFLLLPSGNRQSFILAPAVSGTQPAVATSTLSSGTSNVVRPGNFTLQMSPPRVQRSMQQPIQPAPTPRTIQLAPAQRSPVANTLPVLEKFALQLNSVQPTVAATYEVVAHSGELVAATSPAKAGLQQVVYSAVSPPSQIVRLPGSTASSNLQLINHMVVGGSVAKPVQTITMPQFVIRQPRQIAPISSISPAVMPVQSQIAAPRIVSGTNLVQVPTSQLSTVIIVDSRPEGLSSSPTVHQS